MIDPREFIVGRREQLLRSSVLWFIAGLCIIGCLAVLWSLPSPVPIVLTLCGLSATLILAMASVPMTQIRRRRAIALMSHVASAIELQMPLPTYLRAAAGGERRKQRVRLNRIADRLESGASVYEASWREISELSSLDRSRLMAAEMSLNLRKTTERILQTEQRRNESAPPGAGGSAYFSVLAMGMVIVVFVIWVYVLPKFARIASDFGISLPTPTLWLQQAGQNVFIGVIALFVVGLFFRTIATSARGIFISDNQPGFMRFAIDPLLWHAPIVGRVVRARSYSAMCEALAGALAGGRPAPEAIAIANLPGMNGVLRRRVAEWKRRVSEGQPLAPAARDARLPKLLAEMLTGAGADVAGAATFASRAYGAVSERYLLIARAIMPVVLTALFASATLFIALALFEPLVSLIDCLHVGRVR